MQLMQWRSKGTDFNVLLESLGLLPAHLGQIVADCHRLPQIAILFCRQPHNIRNSYQQASIKTSLYGQECYGCLQKCKNLTNLYGYG